MMDRTWNKWLAMSALSVGLLGTAACGDDTAGTTPAEETPCTVDEDCPDGYICDLGTGFCAAEGDGDLDGDADGDSDPDGDADPDGDTEPDPDGDTEPDPDGDTEPDPDGDTEPDPDGDTEPDPDGDGDSDRRDGRDFDDQCVFLDRADTFIPDEKWFFQVDASLPYDTYEGHGANQSFGGNTMDQVMMTPIVINLTDDNGDGVIDENDIPDVVFTTFATSEDASYQLVTGVLRAVSGDDGSHHWSVGYEELSAHLGIPQADWSPTLGFMPAGSIAAGDINNDGTPEIIAPLWDYSDGPVGFAAIRHDGDILWISDDVAPDNIGQWWGGPSIADLNGDGNPQIIVGSVVYDNTGSMMWDGRDAAGLSTQNATGSNFSTDSAVRIGPLSVVADVNREIDPVTNGYTQEVITGRAVFTHDGDLLWEADGEDLQEGYPGVADFDGSGTPEVVVVSAGTVRIHDGPTGALVWGPVDIPDAGRLGPPTIADMTGDGYLEIGVAGSNGYFVLAVEYGQAGANNTPSYLQARVWEEATQDISSNTTGSSVFDFNGDGSASVVYNDETHLRVFDGATGTVIFEAENPSFTALENPVIADVNNDGTANIIVAASDFQCGLPNQICSPGQAGVRVFGDADDNWVATRRIWNQHAYCINNVEEDGSIPSDPNPSYLDHNTFRLNTLSTIDPQAAPDLLPEDPVHYYDGCFFSVDVWVTNGGAIQVGPGIPVSAYAENASGQVLLGTEYTQAGLAPGESERVTITANIPPGEEWDLVVVVDDDNGTSTRNECDEDNNRMVLEEGAMCSE